MKKMFLLVALLLVFSGVGISNSSEAMRNLQSLVSLTTGNPRFQNFKMIGQPTTCVTQKGQMKEFQFNIQAGQRYIFMASGDNKSADIDMYVMDAQRNIIGFDQVSPQYRGGPGTDCGVFINPMVSGPYAVKVDLFSAEPGDVTLVLTYGTF